MTTPIKLTRKEASIPWGFRIQGGRDYPGGGGSIVVVKVLLPGCHGNHFLKKNPSSAIFIFSKRSQQGQ